MEKPKDPEAVKQEIEARTDPEMKEALELMARFFDEKPEEERTLECFLKSYLEDDPEIEAIALANQEEKKRPQDVVHGLVKAINLFETHIVPEVNKLTFLKEICFNGVIGHDPSWYEDYYLKLNSGLGEILEEIVDVLETFEKRLDDEADEYRQWPEFKEWAARQERIRKKESEPWEKYTGLYDEHKMKLRNTEESEPETN